MIYLIHSLKKSTCTVQLALFQVVNPSFQLGWDRCLQLDRPLIQPGEAKDTSLASRDCVVPKNLVVLSCVLCPGTVLNGSGGGSEPFRRFSHPHCQSQDDVMGGGWKSKESKLERASFAQRARHHGRWMGPMLQWFEQIGKGQVNCQREDQDWCDCGILGNVCAASQSHVSQSHVFVSYGILYGCIW